MVGEECSDEPCADGVSDARCDACGLGAPVSHGHGLGSETHMCVSAQ